MWQSTSVLSRAVALRFSLSWFTFSIALGIISVLMGGIPMPICFAVITSLMTVAALATIPPEYAGADLPAALQARIIRLARTVRLIPGLEAFFMYKRWQHQAEPASYETFVALVCHTCHFLGIIWITEVMARRGLTIWQGIRGSFLVAICTNASGAALVYARGGTTFPAPGGTSTLAASLSCSGFAAVLYALTSSHMRAYMLDQWTAVPLSSIPSEQIANDKLFPGVGSRRLHDPYRPQNLDDLDLLQRRAAVSEGSQGSPKSLRSHDSHTTSSEILQMTAALTANPHSRQGFARECDEMVVDDGRSSGNGSWQGVPD